MYSSKLHAHPASTATKGRENGPKLLQNIAEMDRPPSALYKFGPFTLDIEAGMLLRGVEPTLLGQRAIALLRLLLERAASPVSKDALIEAAWPGLAVEDSNLTVQIAARGGCRRADLLVAIVGRLWTGRDCKACGLALRRR
jgi:DNA-binding response OmpR family regulator